MNVSMSAPANSKTNILATMFGSLLIATCMFFLVLLTPPDGLLGIMTLCIVGAVIGLISIRNRRVAQALIIGFLVRTALVLIHTYLFDLPGSGADAVTFERVGWERSQSGLLATFDHFRIGSGVYYWFISAVYSVIGRSPMTIAGINVLLGTLIVWNGYRTGRLLWNENAGVRSAWWIALFPNLVLNSALILREAFVVYFFSLAIYHFVRWTKSNRLLSIVLNLLFLGLSASFHEGVFIAIPVFAGVAIWRSFGKSLRSKGRIPVKPLLIALTVILVVGTAFASGWGQLFTQAYLERAEIEELGMRQEFSARSRAAYPSSLNVNGPLDILLKGPVRVLYFLFAPFPWMARDFVDLVGLFDSFLYAYFIVLMWRMRHVIRDDFSTRALALAFTAVVFVFSLAVGNYGTAIRHRAKIIIVPIVLAMGYANYRKELLGGEESESISVEKVLDLRRFENDKHRDEKWS